MIRDTQSSSRRVVFPHFGVTRFRLIQRYFNLPQWIRSLGVGSNTKFNIQYSVVIDVSKMGNGSLKNRF
jgi:hypothetical protein